jgi:hypothetical protein
MDDLARSAHSYGVHGRRVPAVCPIDRQTTGNHGHSRPTAEAAALEADEDDRREMLEVAAVLEIMRAAR